MKRDLGCPLPCQKKPLVTEDSLVLDMIDSSHRRHFTLIHDSPLVMEKKLGVAPGAWHRLFFTVQIIRRAVML